MRRTLSANAQLLARYLAQQLHRREDHYDWFTAYLQTTGLQPMVRLVASVAPPGAAVIAAFFAYDKDGPAGPVGVRLMWLGVFGLAAAGVIWVRRWPTRSSSAVFAVTMNVSIALVSVATASPLASLIGCVAFIGTNTYVAALHSIRLLSFSVAVPVAVAAFEGVRLWRTGHYMLAVMDSVLIAGVNVLIPVLAFFCVGAVGFDLLRADRDPLTGLLNRRGFWQQTQALVGGPPGDHTHLVISIVDLDKFKKINDTQGHAAGDRVLVAVANSLRAHVGEGVIARIGGEEFAVAVTAPSKDPESLARRLCDAIAGMPERVTASVGTASESLVSARKRDHSAVVEDLVVQADDAMYYAKRRGGNQHHHHDGLTFSQ